MEWRSAWGTFEKEDRDPLFSLYSEGFAQRCEHIIRGEETWHMAPDEDWVPWCGENLAWLAKEFLGRVDRHEAVNDFFGSWYDIRGRKQTGYFMGHEFVKDMKKTRSLKEVAVLPFEEVKQRVAEWLEATGKQAG